MADVNGIRCCAHCGEQMGSSGRAQYCDPTCKASAKADRRKGYSLKPQDWRARCRQAKCLVCDAGFLAYPNGKSESGWTACCSSACGHRKRSIDSRGRLERLRTVASEAAALKRIATYVAKPRVWIHPCDGCGGPVVARRNGGLHKKRCPACIDATTKRGHRVAKAKRRAVERGASADNIDPIRVFDRDGWRCHLCGRKTPRELRGTYEPGAPELDHVVPLALGGGHTWSNVRCSCRACNGAKGATAVGQLALPMVV